MKIVNRMVKFCAVLKTSVRLILGLQRPVIQNLLVLVLSILYEL